MNMVKISIEMKNPNTPVARKVNQRKNSFTSSFICQDTKVPVKTMTDESSNMATEMPSTPRESLMLRGAYHIMSDVKSISAPSPAARREMYITVVTMAVTSKAEAPTAITPRICLPSLASHNPSSMSRGMSTNNNRKFISLFCFFHYNISAKTMIAKAPTKKTYVYCCTRPLWNPCMLQEHS